MRFLPMESHLAPPQASTAATYQPPIPHSRLLPPQPTIPTLLSPPPPPLLLCLPLSGQRQQPQTEHSGDPLGDPSARVFEVFLIVLNGVQGESLLGGGIPCAQQHSQAKAKGRARPTRCVALQPAHPRGTRRRERTCVVGARQAGAKTIKGLRSCRTNRPGPSNAAPQISTI